MKKITTLAIWLSIFVLMFQWCSSKTIDKQEVVVEQQKEQPQNTLRELWDTLVEITTDFGVMEVVLYDSTPWHRDNFIKLAKEWFYEDLLFHRVMNRFMIQWGDPDSLDAKNGESLWRWWPGYQIDAEIGAFHFKWTLAAARTWWSWNPEKKSSGSQFYIVHWTLHTDAQLRQYEEQKNIVYTAEQKERYKTIGWTPMLDEDYTVFGEVISGLEVIDTIASVQTATGDRPVEDVKMSVKVIE